MLSAEQIQKFKLLYRNRFGKDLSDQEAHEKGAKLLRVIELTYQPMTFDEYKQLEKRRKETK